MCSHTEVTYCIMKHILNSIYVFEEVNDMLPTISMPFCIKVFVNWQCAKTSNAKIGNDEYCIHEYRGCNNQLLLPIEPTNHFTLHFKSYIINVKD